MKPSLGNRNLTFKDKIPLEPGMTCMTKDTIHTHYNKISDAMRRSYMDSGYALSTHCQKLGRSFTSATSYENVGDCDLTVPPDYTDQAIIWAIPERANHQSFLSEKLRLTKDIQIGHLEEGGWTYQTNRRGWTKPLV